MKIFKVLLILILALSINIVPIQIYGFETQKAAFAYSFAQNPREYLAAALALAAGVVFVSGDGVVAAAYDMLENNVILRHTIDAAVAAGKGFVQVTSDVYNALLDWKTDFTNKTQLFFMEMQGYDTFEYSSDVGVVTGQIYYNESVPYEGRVIYSNLKFNNTIGNIGIKLDYGQATNPRLHLKIRKEYQGIHEGYLYFLEYWFDDPVNAQDTLLHTIPMGDNVSNFTVPELEIYSYEGYDYFKVDGIKFLLPDYVKQGNSYEMIGLEPSFTASYMSGGFRFDIYRLIEPTGNINPIDTPRNLENSQVEVPNITNIYEYVGMTPEDVYVPNYDVIIPRYIENADGSICIDWDSLEKVSTWTVSVVIDGVSQVLTNSLTDSIYWPVWDPDWEGKEIGWHIEGFDSSGTKVADGTLTTGVADTGEYPSTVVGWIQKIWDLIKNIWNALEGLGTTILNAVIAALNVFLETLISALTAALEGLWNSLFGWWLPALPNLLMFFPNLLLLIFALIGLFGKGLVFIGTLYSIPADSTGINEYILNGINWARSLSYAGINLYDLVAGIGTLILGLTCFKLLKRLILGVGKYH